MLKKVANNGVTTSTLYLRSMNISLNWLLLLGGLFLLFTAIQGLRSGDLRQFGTVRRKENPPLFWFGVVTLLVAGLILIVAVLGLWNDPHF